MSNKIFKNGIGPSKEQNMYIVSLKTQTDIVLSEESNLPVGPKHQNNQDFSPRSTALASRCARGQMAKLLRTPSRNVGGPKTKKKRFAGRELFFLFFILLSLGDFLKLFFCSIPLVLRKRAFKGMIFIVLLASQANPKYCYVDYFLRLSSHGCASSWPAPFFGTSRGEDL